MGPAISTPLELVPYNYTPEEGFVKESSEAELLSVESKLRGRIHQDYETGHKMTPCMKWRIASAVVAALAAIAAIAVIVATALAASPIVMIAAPLFAIAGFGVYYCVTAVDLDSPKARQAVIQRVAQSQLADIAEEFSPEQIEGYGLLDGVRVSPQGVGNMEQPRLYHQFHQLLKAYHNVKHFAVLDQEVAVNEFNSQTHDFVEWYRMKRQIMNQKRVIRHTTTAVVEQSTQRPSKLLRTANLVCDIGDIFTAADLNRIYAEKMGPWNSWLEGQKASIASAKKAAIQVIEQEWNNLRQPAIAS